MSHRQHQGHFARKRFGQNFLVDTGMIDAIVEAIRPQPADRLVEIGPGLGALTAPLLERVQTLHALELDRDLIARLQQRFGSRLVLHAGDALAFDFASLADSAHIGASLRVVGNLPYNISSPLLFHLASFADDVIDQHFMLQNEVVERMIAEPGSKDYSRLTVMLQYRYAIDKLIEVPPESFEPAPKVTSAVVRMIPRAAGDVPPVDITRLGEVVTAAFSQRRKMLRNTLAAYRSRVDFDALGFDLARRAEDVPVLEYVALAQQVDAGAGSMGSVGAGGALDPESTR
ncbi:MULTISPECIES: 16S rRNA (adenine(1518)-N(6)/adenine(1519)-N(6))-dimethyltransferase RsmA [Burkholderiaceae]|uniref:16S rRNA (adenine(1518)-N(6)/adenine(1519)-N(6))- dimethyltransferase RsmA n=1 Tax=Burkholderiaceae TaxID=119060 RepID=UPI00095A23C2|nr:MULTISPECIES: 16S rRNA (adenine(1518)-N(6)/adenine(1519)-N(6))-dimethyltransferase RsmA [Burkholderiaceae]MCF2134826.1 16S rRNA (adenine(1518)-N(6)/adenine(1519)-N(6))-dimethyltransferase RsmA [Mycetohabitans sp. B3]MCG1040129.1 16S rRNA (adenine(1518)-N(6)/adenine(1519)-N(6))-dimethyltransferase RsmA [Mycetohabitans sp. B7]SIT72989.1 dimethyladenosine transferase [Burkholderia sp. b14]